jgi:glycosyltransferase involved in cell wall biosynthesis
MNRIPCTVALMTRNSATTLPLALKDLGLFEEVLIADGGSTDETRHIAQEFGARVIDQEKVHLDSQGRIIDYSGVRNMLIRESRYPWILMLDSDEELSEKLIEEVGMRVHESALGAFWIPRRYLLDRKVVTCAASYPSYYLRFFHKEAVEGFRKPVHERLLVKEGTPVSRLNNFLLVPVDRNTEGMRRKLDRYVDLELGRHERMSFSVAWRYARAAFRTIIRLALRIAYNRLFCRGVRLPLSIESTEFYYQRRLAFSAFQRWSRH